MYNQWSNLLFPYTLLLNLLKPNFPGDNMTTKQCSVCKQTKPLSEFYNLKKSPDGHAPACRVCQRESHKRAKECNSPIYQQYHCISKKYRNPSRKSSTVFDHADTLYIMSIVGKAVGKYGKTLVGLGYEREELRQQMYVELLNLNYNPEKSAVNTFITTVVSSRLGNEYRTVCIPGGGQGYSIDAEREKQDSMNSWARCI